MDEGHTWFTCCVAPAAPAKQFKLRLRGQPRPTTARSRPPLHADTFSILKTTKVPDAAFKALTAMVASAELLTIYGAMPADPTKQDAWFELDRRELPGHQARLAVPQAMLAYPDIPNHQSCVPNYAKAEGRLPGLPEQVPDHVRARHGRRAGDLKTTLQGIFDEAAP